MKLYRQKLFSSLGSDVVFEFLGRLSGFIHRAKTLHWSAKGKDIHEYLDGFWKSLYEFQDTVAEGWMGIEGKISDPFDIPCVPADELYPLDFIREVEKQVLDFYNLIPADDPRYKGLSGETESFIQEIEKYKYLFGLCYGNEGEKEFSEKSKKLDKKDWTALGLGSAGIIGGHMLKNKGGNLAADKLVEEAKLGKLEAKKGTLKLLQKATRDEMKAATDREVYEKIAGKFDQIGKDIEQKTKEIAESEKLAKKLGSKSKKYTKAGKAVLITSMAAPIIYGSVRAVKKSKENKNK